MPLSPEAGRVLGCLVEKQLTTPQQYPLSLNALVTAANQTTNRDPVVTLADDAVMAAVDELRGLHLLRVVLPSHGRSVKRYRHVLDEAYGLDAARSALLAVLLLRGPQTVGELRARTERMAELTSTGDVQGELAALAEHPAGLARLQPRRPGQKEDRWHQILAAPWNGAGGTVGDDRGSAPGTPPADEEHGAHVGRSDERGSSWTEDADVGPSVASVVPSAPPDRGGLEALRSEVEALRAVVEGLRQDLDRLRHDLGA